jgi:hypothetical protein
MFEKLRNAASDRRQTKQEKKLDRIEAQFEAGRNRQEPSADELTDFNEITRTGPIIGTGGGGPV